MLYRFKFDVDTGVSYETDVALVEAECLEKAKNKLKHHINSLDSESFLDTIFEAEIFTGDVFTGRFGNNSPNSPLKVEVDQPVEIPHIANNPYEPQFDYIPESCRNCPNHPSNGGSGICHCVLGDSKVTC